MDGEEVQIIKEEKKEKPNEGPGKRTRAKSKKNKEEEDSNNIQKIKEAVKKMELIETNVVVMLKNLS